MPVIRKTVRLPEHLARRVQQATKGRGHRSVSAYIRAAIETDLSEQHDEVAAAEAHMAASFDRVSREIRGVRSSQQALFAFVDALAKTILTCVPEPAGEAYDQAVARARFRYDRFVKSVGQGMVGEAGAALARLTKDED
jgi:Arc/MetJ-type ribon-helix-helix transcriptional regulator